MGPRRRRRGDLRRRHRRVDGVTMDASRRHRVDAVAAFIHDTASEPVDRLVAVERDDRAALVAVDAPAEVHIVA